MEEGELYYYRAYTVNSAGTSYGSEVTFLTKPLVPTSFSATTNTTNVDLAWTKGTGADNTTIRYKEGSYPTSRADGAEVYNDTGTGYIHSAGTGTHYYRAWSYVTEGGLEQYSDFYVGDYAHVEPGLVLWFQPSMIVSGTTLPDRSGSGNTGTIIWGANPDSIIVSMGGIASFSSATAEEPELVPSVMPTPEDINLTPSAGATGEGLPLYGLMNRAAVGLGWTTPTTYIIMILLFAIGLGVAGLVATRSSWGFMIGFGATAAAASGITDAGGYKIFPFFIAIICVLVAIFVGYVMRYS